MAASVAPDLVIAFPLFIHRLIDLICTSGHMPARDAIHRKIPLSGIAVTITLRHGNVINNLLQPV
jgi:hypothetical protein